MKTNRRWQKSFLFKLEDAFYAAILKCPSLVSGLCVFTCKVCKVSCKVMIFTCSSPGALPCEMAVCDRAYVGVLDQYVRNVLATS